MFNSFLLRLTLTEVIKRFNNMSWNTLTLLDSFKLFDKTFLLVFWIERQNLAGFVNSIFLFCCNKKFKTKQKFYSLSWETACNNFNENYCTLKSMSHYYVGIFFSIVTKHYWRKWLYCEITWRSKIEFMEYL